MTGEYTGTEYGQLTLLNALEQLFCTELEVLERHPYLVKLSHWVRSPNLCTN